MPSYLQIENISKSYGPKVLFDRIAFNINEGDKVALIAPNGSGKTSLLRILAGKDASDGGGKVLFLKDIRIAFLEQEYAYDPQRTVREQILDDAKKQWKIEGEAQWEYELRMEQLLTQFGLGGPDKRMDQLSGGEVKRVAIVSMLASEPDFYIMDEPTNHLDLDAIELLENFLKQSRRTLFMVTHDRYFLDRICNTVMELDRGQIYIYRGDYVNFLERRQDRIDQFNAETERVRNLFRRELEWIHATPCARTGKAKYRKQAFERIAERAEDSYIQRKVDLGEMASGETYLGNKVINCKDLSFSWEGRCYLDRFTYNFQRYERVGIVGGNASGKTTFLNLITGQWDPSWGGELSGTIDRGESLRIGYYRQAGITFKPGQTVLETVNDTHLLSRFLFPHDMLNSTLDRLSGGEKRRLYLLTILMQKPNLLILDEPTNDLDIVTLEILEEYLKDEYKGSLIIVSHDRHFLDRLVDHLLVFTGGGAVKDFIGNYTEYRSFIKDLEKAPVISTKAESRVEKSPAPVRKKRSWKEEREMEALEAEIAALNDEKASLEAALSSGTLDGEALRTASTRYGELNALLDEKETRWLELSLIG
ncbi:MAG: ABC-F family ATP-binding cassette domain-containing protein [Bacteroidales bacterium]|nr:ABC-F family ATP-binding cassette domain-containing protein [Bacteroidales bacterium]